MTNTFFSDLPASRPGPKLAVDASMVGAAVSAFSAQIDAVDPHVVRLVTSAGGMDGAHDIWAYGFDDLADRDAMFERLSAGAPDLAFLGRVTLIFGPATITAAAERIVRDARKIRRAEAKREMQRQRDHKFINLYARDTKRGYRLDLERQSDDRAEWSVRYDRASERDRLCDWLRWQKKRFGAFLDHAAEHGSEALTRMLLDEMFETERRIKKEGRGAGGMRPLRMWRGD